MLRVRRIQAADQVGVGQVPRPGDPQCTGARAHAAQVLLGGGRHGAQDPHPPVEHDPGRGHPRHERELGVPPLDRQGDPVVQSHGVLADRAHLLRQAGQADRPSRHLLLLPQPTHRLEERHLRMGPALVEEQLLLLVAQLRPAADRCPLQRRQGCGSRAVHVEGEHVGPTHLAGKQARCRVGEDGRVQGDPMIRAVQGLAPAARLGIQGPTQPHERGDIRDRVPDPVPRAGPLDEERLVQVGGRDRVQGDEAEVGQVHLGRPIASHGSLRLGQHLGGELLVGTVLRANGGQPSPDPLHRDSGGEPVGHGRDARTWEGSVQPARPPGEKSAAQGLRPDRSPSYGGRVPNGAHERPSDRQVNIEATTIDDSRKNDNNSRAS